MNRRVFLAATSVFLGGCVGGRLVRTEAPTRPGTLLLENDDQYDHTVTVVVKKMSHRETNVPTYSWEYNHPPPTETPRWRTEKTFEVAAEQEVARPGFIAEAGSYHLEVSVDGTGPIGMWMRFRDAADGDGLWGRVPAVRIYDHDEFSVTAADTGRLKPSGSQPSPDAPQS
jgi:hypothetical protein